MNSSNSVSTPRVIAGSGDHARPSIRLGLPSFKLGFDQGEDFTRRPEQCNGIGQKLAHTK